MADLSAKVTQPVQRMHTCTAKTETPPQASRTASTAARTDTRLISVLQLRKRCSSGRHVEQNEAVAKAKATGAREETARDAENRGTAGAHHNTTCV